MSEKNITDLLREKLVFISQEIGNPEQRGIPAQIRNIGNILELVEQTPILQGEDQGGVGETILIKNDEIELLIDPIKKENQLLKQERNTLKQRLENSKKQAAALEESLTAKEVELKIQCKQATNLGESLSIKEKEVEKQQAVIEKLEIELKKSWLQKTGEFLTFTEVGKEFDLRRKEIEHLVKDFPENLKGMNHLGYEILLPVAKDKLQENIQHYKEGRIRIEEDDALSKIVQTEEIISIPKPKVMSQKQQAIIKKEQPKKGTFLMRRKGGIIDDIFVPESVCRSINLMHKNKVSYILKSNVNVANQFPYLLKITDSQTEKHEDIGRFDLALIELNERDELIIQQNINGVPLFLEEPGLWWQPSIEMIEHFDLQEGDVVELGFYFQGDQVKEDSILIAWKFQSGELDYHIKKERSDSLKMNRKGGTVAGISTRYISDLSGVNVLVVGATPYQRQYKMIIEQNGGNHEQFDSKKPSQPILEGKIKQADVVVLALNMMSHASSKLAIALAKKHGKATESFTGFGNGSLLHAVESALKKKEANWQDERKKENEMLPPLIQRIIDAKANDRLNSLPREIRRDVERGKYEEFLV